MSVDPFEALLELRADLYGAGYHDLAWALDDVAVAVRLTNAAEVALREAARMALASTPDVEAMQGLLDVVEATIHALPGVVAD